MTQMIVPPHVECPDNIRCGQSVALMHLKHFFPERAWDFQDADKICGYVEGKWTWTTTALLNMLDLGMEIVSFSSFDNHRFLKEPVEYMYERFGQEKAKACIENTDIEKALESERRAMAMSSDQWQNMDRDWQWSDAADLLAQGYLLSVWVNSRALYSRNDGQVIGHMVLMFAYDPENDVVTYHDPGNVIDLDGQLVQTNACKGARIGASHFMKAAKNPGAEGGSSLMAFRRKRVG